jgi:hypothetical protein
VFESLGGYDEEFLPCGYDDLDLLERAKAMGNSVEFINCGHHVAIANTEEEAIADCKSEGVTWDEMEKSNRIRSKWNIGHGILVANTQNRILPAATVDTRMI